MTLMEKVLLAQDSKIKIKNAIIAKGVNMDNVTFNNYGNKISEIVSGGGGGTASNGKEWNEIMNDLYTEHLSGKGFTEDFFLIFVNSNVSQEGTIFVKKFSALNDDGDPIEGISTMYNDTKTWELDGYGSKTISTLEQNGNDKYCWVIIRCSVDCLNTDEITRLFSNNVTGLKIIKNSYSQSIFPSRYKLYTSTYINLDYFDMGGMWNENICTNLSNVMYNKGRMKGLYNVPSVQNLSISAFTNLKTIAFYPNATITSSCDLSAYGEYETFSAQGCVNCANVLSGTGNVSIGTEIDITYCTNNKGYETFDELVQSKGWTTS